MTKHNHLNSLTLTSTYRLQELVEGADASISVLAASFAFPLSSLKTSRDLTLNQTDDVYQVKKGNEKR